MSSARIPASIRRVVAARARNYCEYCRCSDRFATESFYVEHIQPQSADGASVLENLAWSCMDCNGHKHAKTQATDPETGETVALFHPLCLVCSLWMISTIDSGQTTETALPTQIETTHTGQSLLLPDWSVISLSMLPPIQTNGQAKLSDRSIRWNAGQPINEVLRLGDLASSLHAEELTLNLIAERSGIAPQDAALSQFELATQQTIGHLAEIVPNLVERKISEVPPIRELVGDKSEQTIAQLLVSDPAIASRLLKSINLDTYSVSSIPYLDAVPLKDFQNWQTAIVNQIPGLSQVPLNAFPQPLNLIGSTIARIDMIYGAKEIKRNRTISGSYQQGFSVACTDNCAYIELDDLENTGRNQRNRSEGLQWISGKYQTVDGGEGCLAGINGGKEPTGRHPFGSLFKVVVMEPSEQSDQVDTALYFRFSSVCGSSPYILGPVPFFQYSANSLMLIGAPDWQATSTGQSTPTTSTPAEQAAFESTDSSKRTSLTRCAGQTVQGINLDRVAQALAALESQQDYMAVGMYTCADDGKNCGRALGKYQFMPYNEYAASVIQAKPGGEEFLQRVQQGNAPSDRDLMQFFPPADQDQAFQNAILDKINASAEELDPRTGQRFKGDRLIERVAQKHFGGDAAAIDSQSSDALGELSLLTYGIKTRNFYNANSQSRC